MRRALTYLHLNLSHPIRRAKHTCQKRRNTQIRIQLLDCATHPPMASLQPQPNPLEKHLLILGLMLGES